MRKFFTLSFLAAALAAGAQSYYSAEGVSYISRHDAQDTKKIIAEMKKSASASSEVPVKDSEQTFKVTCDLHVQPGYEAVYVAAHARDFVKREYAYGDEGPFTLNLPAGTYDLHAEYWRPGLQGKAVVIHENVVVDGDTSADFYASEADVHVEFRSVDENGVRSVLPTWKMTDTEPYYEVLDSGTADNMLFYQFYMHDDYGIISTLYGSGDYRLEEGEGDGERIFDFYMNKLSDKYSYYQMRLIPKDDRCYVVRMSTRSSEDGTVVVNNPSDFKITREEFVNTPVRSQFQNKPFRYGVTLKPVVDDIARGNLNVKLPDETATLFIDAPFESHGDAAFPVNALVIPSTIDVLADVIVNDPDWGEYQAEMECRIFGTPILHTSDGLVYAKSNHTVGGDDSFQRTETSGAYISEFPWHSGFSFTKDQKDCAYGNNTPVMVTADKTYMSGEKQKSSGFVPVLVGRYGEVRQTDVITLLGSLKVGGQEVASDFSSAANYLRSLTDPVKYDLNIVDPNVKVDEYYGANITSVHVDQTTGDLAAPTLQMLQFRNADGMITDRFSKDESVFLALAAADFSFNYKDYANYWFSQSPVSVKVGYAPFDSESVSDAFTDLDVSEEADMYFAPTMGQYFTAEIKNIEESSPSGWYDLRVAVTDGAGNTQTQIISPAFKKDTGLGTSEVAADNFSIRLSGKTLIVGGADSPKVEIFNAAGSKVMSSFGIRLGLDSLPSGVYIIKVTSGSRSTSRKVML